MAYLNVNTSKKQIFVLLGPSECDKTTFGVEEVRRACESGTSLSTKPRQRKYISAWREPKTTDTKKFCHELINETFMHFKASESPVLIVDCIKHLEDAEYVAAQAKKHGLEITRALLFNDEHFVYHWRGGEHTDLSCLLIRYPHHYFHEWRKKSNDLINYYISLQLLSSLPDRSHGLWFQSLDSYPICPCPKNMQFILLHSDKIQNVFMRLYSVLNVDQFQFNLPASFVHSYRDARWVANPNQYYVTIKADGVRCLLFKANDCTYLITRKKEIYPCHIEDDMLPENTVLDGELLPSVSMSEIHPKVRIPQLKTSVFLVFDVLALSGDVLWKWPFSFRQEKLCELNIRKDIVTVMKQASTSDEILIDQDSDGGHKNLIVHCALKGHRQSTPDDILACLNSAFPYSCDGLVFTSDKAYVFGPDPLMFKWQSEDDIHGDIQLTFREDVQLKSAVYECRWSPATDSWLPLFVRHDKTIPNSDQTIDHLKKISQQPYTKGHFMSNLAQIRILNKHKEEFKSSEPSALGHPTNSLKFDELFSTLNELVQLGEIGKTVDFATNLEIFSYHVSASFSDPMVRLSRGLVLHPPSKTIVTKPFVRFFENVGIRDPYEIVEATIKFDGSLGIAFLWNNEVMVTTRRRMDSKQAVWARQWIKDHCNLNDFQVGYTYLFEIIYQNNTVVVNYLFEGVVLLAITDDSGHELPYQQVLHCAKAIGFFMVTPRIIGSYSEVLWYCGGIETHQNAGAGNWLSFTSGALPVNEKRQEGWVVKFNDGSRQKIVYKWWKSVSKVAQLVQPQVVWLLLTNDKIKDVFGSAPSHFKAEIHRMMQAIGRKFEETLRLVEVCLRELDRTKNFVDALTDVYEWWDETVKDQTDGCGKKEELASSIESSEENGECLGPLLDELKPYRHVLRLPIRHRSLLVYEEPTTQSSVPTRQSNVNLSPFYNSTRLNFLRLPILKYICPTSPVFEGYEPSDNFKQTWCKGWKTLPINQCRFVQTILQRNGNVSPFFQIPVEVIVMILNFLDHEGLTAMAKVSVGLRQIVKSSKTLRRQKRPRRKIYEPDDFWKVRRQRDTCLYSWTIDNDNDYFCGSF